jgi:hypothetical protein
VYKYKPVPPGFKVLYAIVSITGTEKAYIGKAGHHEKGAVYRILHKEATFKAQIEAGSQYMMP